MSWSPVMERATSPPRHSRVCSSMMEAILTGRPSVHKQADVIAGGYRGVCVDVDAEQARPRLSA
jgi:hypothetical protein